MDGKEDSFPFEVDPDSSSPPWLQLRKRLVFLIDSGYYKPGDQLPKIRELAVEISLNFNTVNKAYLSLQSDGYVKSIRGKGMFVSDPLPGKGAGSAEDLEAVLDECLHACKSMGLTYEEAADQMVLRAKMLVMIESLPYRLPGSNVIALHPDVAKKSKEA
ncbi:GntR family transcriptional regulator [Eggerthella sinensis]|jgi:GntR family transcriptional regulator|uniref:GntR family transcriptional regulator n=1 Tax=Eggerthella sinensis TaxID=242230 RepID=A0A3N0IYS2_9ACTN|nr:GntR family transcriptional regulator [Eggerthella sinensis]MCB7036818.1 GntR family transcriptional regulator [Eggerthella sinensis]RDB67682.1 GntR family transcriptional regulator [Eggerthella sinensis]RNM41866.1 GntR family transcriptional regulator [Eggerthella sinensis]